MLEKITVGELSKLEEQNKAVVMDYGSLKRHVAIVNKSIYVFDRKDINYLHVHTAGDIIKKIDNNRNFLKNKIREYADDL